MNAKFLFAYSVACLLVGCGGGGSDTPATSTPAATFPLAAAYKAEAQTARSDAFTVSGTCGGTATLTKSAATSATTFEGSPAFTQIVTQQFNLTGCTPASSSATGTNYVDQTTYLPRGTVTSGIEYGVAAGGTFAALPATVKVGDAGTIGAINLFSTSAKTTATGTRTLSYSVTSDTATTAKVTIQSIDRDVAGATTATRQSLYRTDTSGNLTLLTLDVVLSSGTHLVLTKT